MSDSLTVFDRPILHKMDAYTQLVSCSIRNDAGPMGLQDAEICLDGKGRPSNLRRSRGLSHVDSYSVSALYGILLAPELRDWDYAAVHN